MKTEYVVVETYNNQETDVILTHKFPNRLEAEVKLNELARRLLEEGWHSTRYEEDMCEFERVKTNSSSDFTYRVVVEIEEVTHVIPKDVMEAR